MRVLLALGTAAAIIAAAVTLSAAARENAHKIAAKPSYYLECFALRSAGNDINAQASQGWTVKAMVDHQSQDGQACLLVLFERQAP